MTTDQAMGTVRTAETVELAENEGIIHIQDRVAGDIRLKFDFNDAEQVAKAREAWDSAKAKGYAGYTVNEGTREVVSDFPETAQRIVMTPQIQGG